MSHQEVVALTARLRGTLGGGAVLNAGHPPARRWPSSGWVPHSVGMAAMLTALALTTCQVIAG